MKKIRIILYLTLPITIILLLTACQRTYPDGTTELVPWYTSVLDTVVGLPAKEGNPEDIGLLGIIGALASAGGYGWIRTFINKKNAEKARDFATDEKRELSARYQAVKDVIRDDGDSNLLDKAKQMAGIAAKAAEEQKNIYQKYEDTADGMKAAYAEVIGKNS